MKLAWVALAFAASDLACTRTIPAGESSGDRAPGVEDRGEVCLDIGTRRACWEADSVRVVERPVPNRPEPEGGWRCAGFGAERRCSPRAHGTGSFACDASGSCVQRRPRYPDDGEWECTDRSSVVICRGGVPAAGTVPGPPDPGWLCGNGSSSLWGSRVCVDLSPDVPSHERSFSCRYEGSGDERRVCIPSAGPRIGAECVSPADCPNGALCVSQVCLPPKPRPSCFVDLDCGSGQCQFGTCAGPAR